jgi:HK97 family phage portal protein
VVGLILRTASGRDVEYRVAGDWPSTSLTWPTPLGQGYLAQSGLLVTPDIAQGVPAVGSVIRQASGLLASMPYTVYKTGTVSATATGWQADLFADSPSPDVDSFQFFYDVALSLEATQNAFIQKAFYKKQLKALIVLDPQRMIARRTPGGGKEYKFYDEDGVQITIPSSQIIHVRGYTPSPGAMNGVSLIQLHRDAIGSAVAMEKFEGDYFRNNAQVPFFFKGAANQNQARDAAELWNAQHAGAGNQWKPGALWGAMDVTALPLSMQDANFIEAKRVSIEDACRIWHWPHHLLELSGEQPIRNELWWTEMFIKFYMVERLRRIEKAFDADPDLFHGQPVYGRFVTEELERASEEVRAATWKNMIQGGVMTPNEARAREGLPPHPGGDELQFPLVGGGAVDGGSEPPSGTPDASPASQNGRAHVSAEELLTR